MEVLVDEPISDSEFKQFEQRYLNMIANDSHDDSIIFDYAWACIRRNDRHTIRQGIELLEKLSITGSDPSRRRDYLFYAAVSNNKLGDYERARDCIEKFLTVEPNNFQAQELRKIIRNNQMKAGAKGAAIIGAGAILVGGLIALMSKRR